MKTYEYKRVIGTYPPIIEAFLDGISQGRIGRASYAGGKCHAWGNLPEGHSIGEYATFEEAEKAVINEFEKLVEREK